VPGRDVQVARARFKKVLATGALLGAFVVAMLAAPASMAFHGHHCRVSTCSFFTSSYGTARYYYDVRTCDRWKGLSRSYLQGFKSRHALLRHYDRKLHRPC
jgi:hypothetical protein